MSTGLLNELMERATELDEDEKLKLAYFLASTARVSESNAGLTEEEKQMLTSEIYKANQQSDVNRRDQHMNWLKANRDKYAGQYVALDGARLVGTGNTICEAKEAARQQSIKKPFVVYLFPTDSLPFGGW